MSTVVIAKAIVQPVSPLNTSFQKKLALSLLSSSPHQNLWGASFKPLHTFATSSSRQGFIPALPRKVKQDNIEKGCVIQEHKLHRCNKSGPLHQTTYLIATQSQHLSQRNSKHCNVYLDFLQLMGNLRPGTYQEEVHRYRCLFINFRSGFGRPKGCYGASRRSFKTRCVLGRAPPQRSKWLLELAP
jgi:hypothetical protein